IVLTICLMWTFWLLATIQMGEFSAFRRPLLIALPIGYALALRFVDEFLAVRALGILCLLAAEPLLDAAFLRYETSRLLITGFAYVLIVAGMFWVAIPYVLRDQINLSAKSVFRLRCLRKIGFMRKQCARSNTAPYQASSRRTRNCQQTWQIISRVSIRSSAFCMIQIESLKTTCAVVALKI